VNDRVGNDPRGKGIGVSTTPKAGYGNIPTGNYGQLRPGTEALAAWTERSGGTITAGQEGGHSPTGGHGAGQSLDIKWDANGPAIWASLFPHRAKFRLLLGPPGLYMWGQPYQNEKDRKNHQNHIHVQYTGSEASLRAMLGDAAIPLVGADVPAAGPPPPATGTAAPPTKQEIAAKTLVSSLSEAIKSVADDIPEAAKVLGPQMKALMKDVADGVASPEALARIKAAGAKIRHELANMLQADELRDKIPVLRKLIRDAFSGEDEAALLKRVDAYARTMAKFIKDGITDQELATLKAKTKQLNAAIADVFGEDQQERAAAALKKLRGLFEAGFVDEVTFVKTQKQLERIAKMVNAAIADEILTPAELAKINKAWAAVNQVIAGAVAEMDESRIKLDVLGRDFRKLWADGLISADDAAKIRAGAGQIKGAVAEAIAGAAEAVENGYRDFDTAWSAFRSHLEAVFRETVVAKFQLTIDFASAYEQMAVREARLREALAAFSKALEGQLTSDEQAVSAALERVRKANQEYTDAIISQDQERIKRAIDERLAANAALKALEEQSLSERAQTILTAGKELIAAEADIGQAQVAEQKRIWEETKTAALAGVLAVVDRVATELRNGKITWAQAVTEIGTALTNAGMDAGSAADLLGQNVSGSMGLAARAIETAVGLLATAINNLVKVMGGAVGEARGHVTEAEALYLRLQKIRGASEAEAQRIANAAASAGIAQTPGQAAPSNVTSSSPGSQAGGPAPQPDPPGPAPWTPPDPYLTDPQPQPPPSNPGDPVQYYADGGVAWRRAIANIGERFPEAMIPLPPWMNARLRAAIIGLAQGGWRSSRAVESFLPPRGPAPPPAAMTGRYGSAAPSEGILSLRALLEQMIPDWRALLQGGPSQTAETGGGGDFTGLIRAAPARRAGAPPPILARSPSGGFAGVSLRGGDRIGPPVIHVTVPVSVDAGVLTSERELGETIAEIATPAIRSELIRIGNRNENIFGGRA
jgi:hypothetical protein